MERLHQYGLVLGPGPTTDELVQLIEWAAAYRLNALIVAESGGGKELVARAIHHFSRKSSAPFIAIDCGALVETLASADFLGIEEGIATTVKKRRGVFEQAGVGDVFLDEVGNLIVPNQHKLLRLLQEKTAQAVGGTEPITISARVISATNHNLVLDASEGRFTLDLYYRLCQLRIEIRPLRERRTDIPILTEHFIPVFAADFEKPGIGLTDAAKKLLLGYDYLGNNVRELANILRLAVMMETERLIDAPTIRRAAEMQATICCAGPQGGATSSPLRPGNWHVTLKELDRAAARMVLERNGGNKSRTAEELDISRGKLNELLTEVS
jgi:DNA-binding NtrC family response regulator